MNRITLLDEGSKISLRRFIVFSWSILVLVLYSTDFFTDFTVPSSVDNLTYMVWGSYFLKNLKTKAISLGTPKPESE